MGIQCAGERGFIEEIFVFSYSDFSILLNFGVDSMIEYDK